MREESTGRLRDLLKRIDVTEVENFRKKHALRENEGFPAFIATERDYILRFCFALGLNLRDTQRALKLYGMRELYAKDPRDIVLIVAVNKKIRSVDQVNELLQENGQELLRESRR